MTSNSSGSLSSASVKLRASPRTVTEGIAQLHCSQFQDTTTAKERGSEKRRKRIHRAGSSDALLQADNDHTDRGLSSNTGTTLETFTVRLQQGEEMQSTISTYYSFLFSCTSSFLFRSTIHQLPVLEVICLCSFTIIIIIFK